MKWEGREGASKGSSRLSYVVRHSQQSVPDVADWNQSLAGTTRESGYGRNIEPSHFYDVEAAVVRSADNTDRGPRSLRSYGKWGFPKAPLRSRLSTGALNFRQWFFSSPKDPIFFVFQFRFVSYPFHTSDTFDATEFLYVCRLFSIRTYMYVCVKYRKRCGASSY